MVIVIPEGFYKELAFEEEISNVKCYIVNARSFPLFKVINGVEKAEFLNRVRIVDMDNYRDEMFPYDFSLWMIMKLNNLIKQNKLTNKIYVLTIDKYEVESDKINEIIFLTEFVLKQFSSKTRVPSVIIRWGNEEKINKNEFFPWIITLPKKNYEKNLIQIVERVKEIIQAN